MEYNLSKQTASVCNNFLDTVNEQLVDVDINLPDYCPDIEKILKCTLIPKVYSRSISGGQLVFDGASVIRVLYCDSVRKNIRCYEQTVPFSATFNLKNTPQQYLILADTKSEYINCRALSPRKLVIHGAFSLYAKVMSKDTADYYCLDEASDLKTKQHNIAVSDMTVMCQEQFSLTEDITVGDKAPVESLLTYEVSASITDLKSLHQKLMLSAELTLKVMYLCDIDSGEIEHLSYVIPISRIIDCEGADDDTVNIPFLDVMSYDLHIRSDTQTEGSALSLDVRLCFSDIGYNEKSLKVIDDVYSTCYSLETKHSTINCESEHIIKDMSFIEKTTIVLDNTKISKVIDICGDGLTLSPVMSDSKLSLCGKVNFCMLIDSKEQPPVYIERTSELELLVETDKVFDNARLESCHIDSISFRLVDDNTIELRTKITAKLLLCKMVSLNPVTKVVSLEDKPLSKEDCSMILYYAQDGEDIWSIAKSHLTDPDLIMSENSLDSEKLVGSCMLMIPIESSY